MQMSPDLHMARVRAKIDFKNKTSEQAKPFENIWRTLFFHASISGIRAKIEFRMNTSEQAKQFKTSDEHLQYQMQMSPDPNVSGVRAKTDFNKKPQNKRELKTE